MVTSFTEKDYEPLKMKIVLIMQSVSILSGVANSALMLRLFDIKSC